MRAWFNDLRYKSSAGPLIKQYILFLDQIHSQPDPFGINVLIEPKFLLTGQVFPGGWCRPQNDGPGVRATTLILFANWLLQNGQDSFVKLYLWTGNDNVKGGGLIKRDLDWLATPGNFASNTCDLWEEVQSTDFFWNRMVHNRALWMGATFAQAMGNKDAAAGYAAMQQQLNATLFGHWNGQFIYESTNRQLDGAVLAALNEAYDPKLNTPFRFTSSYVAQTVVATINAMCAEFPINNIDSARGIPGVLIGRYPGDHYGAPVGPWILLSAYLAQVFYRTSSESLAMGRLPLPDTLAHWRRVVPTLATKVTLTEFASSMLAMGDGVMLRIRAHVAGSGFHLSEQFNGQTGFESSATDLTWSYAAVLKAMDIRKTVTSMLHNQKQ